MPDKMNFELLLSSQNIILAQARFDMYLYHMKTRHPKVTALSSLIQWLITN